MGVTYLCVFLCIKNSTGPEWSPRILIIGRQLLRDSSSSIQHQVSFCKNISKSSCGNVNTWIHFPIIEHFLYLKSKELGWGSKLGYVLFVCFFVCYPAGVSGRVLYLTRFFLLLLLATLPRLITSICPDRFQPNLVTRTPDPWHSCHMTRIGSKVT